MFRYEICRAVIICHFWTSLSCVLITSVYTIYEVVCIESLNQVVFINFIHIYIHTHTHTHTVLGSLFFSCVFFYILFCFIDVSHDKIPLNINMHHCWRIIFHIKHAQVRPQRTFTSLFYFYYYHYFFSLSLCLFFSLLNWELLFFHSTLSLFVRYLFMLIGRSYSFLTFLLIVFVSILWYIIMYV